MEDIQAAPPRVTALIVSRDRGEALRRCLDALEKSAERETLEVLVVDSGSRDTTPEVTAAFPAVTTLRLPKHFGKTKALNIGVRTAKGDFVLLMGPEVEVAPDSIMRLWQRISTDDSVGGVCPYIERAYPLPSTTDLAGAWRSGVLPGARAVDAGASEVVIDYPAGAPLMVRRQFIKGMNYFDERFGEHWADLELCWQLRNAGKKILVLPVLRVDIGPVPDAPVAHDPLYSADAAIGAAAYIGKHYGTAAGLKFRLSALAGAMGRAVTLRNPGYNFKVASALLSGQKVDGRS